MTSRTPFPQSPHFCWIRSAFVGSAETWTAVMSGGEGQRVAQRDHGAAVHAADGQDHAMPAHARGGPVVLQGERARRLQVVAVDREEDGDQDRDDDAG